MSSGKVVGVIIGVLVVVLGIGLFVYFQQGTGLRIEGGVGWNFNGEAWIANGSVPDCPEPLVIRAPTDVTLATSILYPGQNRTGGYKTHGGFRFDGKTNEAVNVVAPMDAYLAKASRYIEHGEEQYLMLFIHPCGIVYRFDHLLTLTPKWQRLMDQLPPAQIDDSRTTDVIPPVKVRAGEEIATAVGFKLTQNVSFDFGLYDLRARNAISKNATWLAQHSSEREYGFNAVCWLDYLEPSAQGVVKNLPASANDGRQSDYCL